MADLKRWLLMAEDFVATVAGGAIAISVQHWDWKLQAQKLLLNTLEDLEERMENPSA
jgi:hypothetical protein